MKWYFKAAGDHTHVRVIMNGAFCGALCFRNDEFELIRESCPWITFIAEQCKKYVIGLRMGGLMEDPEFHTEKVREVEAESLTEAKAKWAALTGEDRKPTWDPVQQTVWGWSLVELQQ